MRVIIAGSRNFNDYKLLLTEMDQLAIAALKANNCIDTILSGTARGADVLGEQWATNKRIPLERYPADWQKHGRAAGMKRNYEMAKNADALIAFWNGKSKGTEHMIAHAREIGLKVHVVKF